MLGARCLPKRAIRCRGHTSVVGLELSARAFPVGGGVRDEAQVRLLGTVPGAGSAVWLAHRGADAYTTRSSRGTPGWARRAAGRDRRRDRLRDIQGCRPASDVEAARLRLGAGDQLQSLGRAATGQSFEFLDGLMANYPVPQQTALRRALAAGADPGGYDLIVLTATLIPVRRTNQRPRPRISAGSTGGKGARPVGISI